MSRDQILTFQKFEQTMMTLVNEGKTISGLYEFGNMMQHFGKELYNTYMIKLWLTNPSICDMNYDGQFLTCFL